MKLAEPKEPPQPGELAAAAKARLIEWGVENFELWLAEERDEHETNEKHLFAAAAEVAEEMLAQVLRLAVAPVSRLDRGQRFLQTTQIIICNASARCKDLMEPQDVPPPAA